MLLQMTGFHFYGLVFILDMQHIFCIHSSTYRHFSSFHFSAVVNSAAVNLGVQVFFNMLILFPLDIYPVGDCWIMVVAVLIF
jgi:hypothetical protein